MDGYDGAASERHQRDLGRASNLRRLQSRLDHAPLGRAFAKVCAEGAVVRREREADAAFATRCSRRRRRRAWPSRCRRRRRNARCHEAAAALEKRAL